MRTRAGAFDDAPADSADAAAGGVSGAEPGGDEDKGDDDDGERDVFFFTDSFLVEISGVEIPAAFAAEAVERRARPPADAARRGETRSSDTATLELRLSSAFSADRTRTTRLREAAAVFFAGSFFTPVFAFVFVFAFTVTLDTAFDFDRDFGSAVDVGFDFNFDFDFDFRFGFGFIETRFQVNSGSEVASVG